MYNVLVEKTLDIPRKKVFDALVDFGGLEKVLPDMIASCDVAGNGIGALRTVKLNDGGTIVERLEIAHDDSVFAYSVTFNDALPFDNYCAVVTLEDDGDRTIARWGSNWVPKDGATEAEIRELLDGLYSTLLDGLHKIA
jgi:Polyketide cyclase / dehydrase and lipid transport